MESRKKSRGRSKSRASESEKTERTTNLNGSNVNLTKVKDEQVELTEKDTCESIEDPKVDKNNVERETSSVDKQSGTVKDVDERVVKNSAVIIENPKEKVPKGRKLKSLEAMQTDSISSEKEKKVVSTSQLDPSITIKEEPNETDLYPVSSSESLGKGKRARIPNKRYSDIIASPSYTKKSLSHVPENGNDTDISVKEEIGLSPSYGSSTSRNSSPLLKRTKLSTDLSDPKYLKPFKYGWRRELVWRSIYDESKNRVGDIYYYTPEGKKVRSRREVSEYLTNKDLTIDNFSFFKDALGIDDPEKETIRDAKVKMSDSQEKLVDVNTLKNTVHSPKYPKLGSSEPTSSKSTNQRLANKKLASQKLTNKILTNPKLNITNVAKSKFSSTKVRGIMTGPKPIRSKVLLKRLKGHGRIKPKRKLNDLDKLPPKRPSRKSNVSAPINKEPMKPEKSEEKMEVVTSPKITQKSTRSSRNSKQKITSPPNNPEVRTPSKKRTIKLSSITNGDEKDKEDNRFMDNYLQNLSYGYNTLLYVFQYLKVSDLLRAGCVCTMWRDIASHPTLWKTVRMKNSQVYSFEDFANSLKKHGTIHLDLRKMLLPTGGDEIWPEFSKAIEKVDTLRRIELCRCPASVVENLAQSNPRLEVLNAITIRCENMNLEPLKSLTEIKELRLKSTAGLTLTSNIDSLRDMKYLKHLSLTSIRDLDSMNLDVIAELTNLESLDLGECTDFPKNFGGDILIKLTKLEKLRLEKGQGNCHTFEILEAVKQMNQLDQLELVNFDIKSGFDKALGACQNIKKLLIIPTYISQSATTNHMVLGGVLRLQKTLSHFVWGVTLELLRVTELFVDQCEEPKEKKEKKQTGSGDCIPVLKPVPLLLDKDNEIAPALEPPQVEILALPSLQKLLMQNLPTTRVKILKIPFHATWRQSITDSVN